MYNASNNLVTCKTRFTERNGAVVFEVKKIFVDLNVSKLDENNALRKNEQVFE